MRNSGGYEIYTYGNGRVEEHDTFTCAHCNKVVRVRPKCDPADLGGFCGCCAKLVCPSCVGKGCDPLERKLERAEASYHARRSYEGG